jgi:hypothetical protein
MQVRNKKKTCRIHNKSTQKILSCVTLTKRAHLVDQTGAPRHESPRINIRAHLSVSLRKAELVEAHLGLAEPQV